jgi:hypothetical protein
MRERHADGQHFTDRQCLRPRVRYRVPYFHGHIHCHSSGDHHEAEAARGGCPGSACTGHIQGGASAGHIQGGGTGHIQGSGTATATATATQDDCARCRAHHAIRLLSAE